MGTITASVEMHRRLLRFSEKLATSHVSQLIIHSYGKVWSITLESLEGCLGAAKYVLLAEASVIYGMAFEVDNSIDDVMILM